MLTLGTARPTAPHRFDNAGSNNGGDGKPGDYDSPRSIESQLVRRENSLHLPRPSECSMPGTHSDMCITRIRRNHLVEDALDEIARQYRKDLFKPLRVHFIGEEGIDAGGVKKEFFQLLVAELLTPDYGMLVYQPESNTYWWVGAGCGHVAVWSLLLLLLQCSWGFHLGSSITPGLLQAAAAEAWAPDLSLLVVVQTKHVPFNPLFTCMVSPTAAAEPT
jgi:hypothetical protein